MNFKSKRFFKAIGLMSGTSCDGLDICFAEFVRNENKWSFNIVKAETISYNLLWKERLAKSHTLNGLELATLDADFGKFCGEEVKLFLQKNNLSKPDLIASHGHTVFHQPAKGVSLQIGNGSHIAAITNCSCIYNFRNLDVAFKGQGAPLVPLGDYELFSDYDALLNLGGIANITFLNKKTVRAYDIIPFNILLNDFSNLLGKPFDEGGKIAALGKLNTELFCELHNCYRMHCANKDSLSREFVDQVYLPTLNKSNDHPENILATLVEFYVKAISLEVQKANIKNLLLTGGGAYHKHFTSLLTSRNDTVEIVIPTNEIINFKEALIFAFLGVLRMLELNNTLPEVTKAIKAVSAGDVIFVA